MRHLIPLLVAALLSTASFAGSDPAPAIRLPGNGGEIALQDFRGKVVYVDFWASWCTPCRKSFPWMQKIQTRYEDQGLMVLAINLDANRADADDFLHGLDVNFPIAYDPDGTSAELFKVVGMPSSYLIDRNGEIRQRHVGFLDKNAHKTELQIEALLQE